jgi:hypothetical protein
VTLRQWQDDTSEVEPAGLSNPWWPPAENFFYFDFCNQYLRNKPIKTFFLRYDPFQLCQSN